MSEPTHSRFDELLSKYLDASLEPDGEAELLYFLSSERFAARFREATRLHNEIAGLLAGSVPDQLMISLVRSDLLGTENPLATSHTAYFEAAAGAAESMPPEWRMRAGRLLALAALLACLLAVTAILFRGPGPVVVERASEPAPAETAPPGDPVIPDMAAAARPVVVPIAAPLARMEVLSVQGEVYLTDDTGPHQLSAGRPLDEEATIRTLGSDSRATLGLADGTEIVLMDDTSFSVSIESGRRRLLLNEGMLNATVARQPKDAPLVFETAEAETTVHGTDFALLKEPEETILVVRMGLVGLRRFSQGEPEVLIEAGYYGHVEEGVAIKPSPMSYLPKKQQMKVDRPRKP